MAPYRVQCSTGWGFKPPEPSLGISTEETKVSQKSK